jgi:hypothetical protein
MRSSPIDRDREIQRVRALLERDAYPRLRMFEMIAATGTSGFVASYGLLHAGLVAMWARYPVAIAIAYVVFVFLLWLFLRSPGSDSIELADDVFDSARSSARSGDGPGKGDIGGSSFWSSAPFDLDLPIVAVLVAIVALLLSAAWIINAAPLLFAELIVDSALAAGLIRRLQASEGPRYLETALHRTFAPFAIAVVLATITGWCLQRYAPEARSIVDVLVHASKAR